MKAMLAKAAAAEKEKAAKEKTSPRLEMQRMNSLDRLESDESGDSSLWSHPDFAGKKKDDGKSSAAGGGGGEKKAKLSLKGALGGALGGGGLGGGGGGFNFANVAKTVVNNMAAKKGPTMNRTSEGSAVEHGWHGEEAQKIGVFVAKQLGVSLTEGPSAGHLLGSDVAGRCGCCLRHLTETPPVVLRPPAGARQAAHGGERQGRRGGRERAPGLRRRDHQHRGRFGD